MPASPQTTRVTRPDRRESWVKITPELAARWLAEHNYDDNRPVNEPRVRNLARQITKGLWAENAETIKFSPANKLLDGQHRLRAIVLANKPVVCLVVWGVPESSFTTMDQNYVRSPAQILRSRGHKDSAALAAAAKAVYLWETTGDFDTKGVKVYPDEIELVLDVHPALKESVTYAGRVRRRIPTSPAITAALHYILTQAKPRKSKPFWDALLEGVADHAKHPAIALREKLINERLRHARRWKPSEVASLTIRAWNAYSKGNDISRLALKKDGDGKIRVPAIHGLGRNQGNRGRPSRNGSS